MNFFVPDGSNGWKLDWNAVTQNGDKFKQIYSNWEGSHQIDVGSWDTKYEEGMKNTVIDYAGLPDPGNVAKPPTGR